MKYILFFALFIFIQTSYAQITPKREIVAVKTEQDIKIDANLDEPAWQTAPLATDFVQFEPVCGSKPSQRTEVRFLYDNTALYIGAMIYDSAPDSIITRLVKRDDNMAYADYLGILLSPYNDGQNQFEFWTMASGVQADVHHCNGVDDIGWNAVWYSKTAITKDGWVVEMKIPYSALRFPKKEEQVWGLNIWRSIKRKNEFTTWHQYDRNINGFPNQMGILKGLKNIEPPIRLSFTPYVSGYMEDNSATQKKSYSYKGGLDLKYGINESFTLDMMLIPDFGQVGSDDEVLNLSSVETKYNEKRSFFTEGTDLFNKAGIFYSRRIGGKPKKFDAIESALTDNEVINENPSESQLLNATKISGRTKNGLGIGFLNAMTSNTFATISNDKTDQKYKKSTQPFTNYNLVVFDQNLKNNSYISLINTNYSCFGDEYYGNVTATDIKLAEKTNTYAIFAKAGLSSIFNAANKTYGYFYNASIDKISGRFRFKLNNIVLNDKYNPNDLGYIENNNQMTNDLVLEYNRYEPVGNIINYTTKLTFHNTRLYNPSSYMMFEIYYEQGFTFKNYWSLFYYFGATPINKYDYFEPRVFGWKYEEPTAAYFGGGFETDNRRTVWFRTNNWYWRTSKYNKESAEFNNILNVKLGSRFNFLLSNTTDIMSNAIGFVDKNLTNDTIYFGRRKIVNYVNTLETSYIFNKVSSLSFRLRHYLSVVKHQQYYILNSDGTMNENCNYTQNADIDYNAFTIDLIYSWEFLPGSELSIAWKNGIFTRSTDIVNNYFTNLSNTLESDRINRFSVKFLYYIDYLSFRRKK